MAALGKPFEEGHPRGELARGDAVPPDLLYGGQDAVAPVWGTDAFPACREYYEAKSEVRVTRVLARSMKGI
jgi:hypothetical protein